MAVMRLVLPAAWAISVAIGLAFVFVKAPHPWGWEGFDDYRRYALALARGEMFPTLEVPWGYPAFLAVFYRAFGDRQWIPLVAQVLLNSTIPLMLYATVRRRVGEREARLAALLIAVFSFNTVYASTQTSDSLCTVLFVAACALFLRAHDVASNAKVAKTAKNDLSLRALRPWRSTWAFAASGLVCGLAMQVRPNLLLLPFWFAAVSLLLVRPRPAVRHLALFVLAAFLVITPWVVRNARLTGRFIPASAHGGIQLWYGSLQVSPYFPNWFDNPRQVFGERAFEYSRPDGHDLVVSIDQASRNCPASAPDSVALTYWTDRTAAPVSLPAKAWQRGGVTFAIPPQPADTAIYYYFVSTWPSGGPRVSRQTPFAGPIDPLIHFVTTNDFGDADRHADFVDVFDIVRLVRHLAWHEPVAIEAKLDLDRDGSITRRDLDLAVGLMNSDKRMPVAVPLHDLVSDVKATVAQATLIFRDGSSLAVPRTFSGRVLDLDVHGTLARGVMNSRRSFQSFILSERQLPALRDFVYDECVVLAAGIDQVFYRAEPQSQDRYVRLALDDIGRTPIAYGLASVRRMIGIFVTVGSGNRDTAHQFLFSRLLYAAATVVSLTVFVLFVSGIVVAWRRHADVVLLVAAVLYVPMTICPFLTTARYSISGQPFVFAFVAVALVALYDRFTRP